MEVACCDADHEGEWEGEWEECEVVADHGETCDVRIVEDGEVCRGVPRRLVRAMAAGIDLVGAISAPPPQPRPAAQPRPPPVPAPSVQQQGAEPVSGSRLETSAEIAARRSRTAFASVFGPAASTASSTATPSSAATASSAAGSAAAAPVGVGPAANSSATPRAAPLKRKVAWAADVAGKAPASTAMDGHAKRAKAASTAPPPPPAAGGLRMEVACCDADHEGEWEGEWEECEVVADHGETCDVRIVEDGEVCRGVPRRLVRAALEAGPRSLATGSAGRLVRRRSRIGATAAAVMDALAPMAAAVRGVF